jgi:hypothetical protein
VALALDPPQASVQIDGLPVVGDLLLDEGTSHVLLATAPGRISRRLSFAVKAGLELSVPLGRTLPLPSPADPEPSPAEQAWRYPARPAVRGDIDRAYTKLDCYANCLALLGYGEGATPAAMPGQAEMSGCVQLLDQASALTPTMAPLHATGLAYLHAVRSGQSPGACQRALLSFRAEYLAVRAGLELEELSRQEADEGRTAAWHMRRVALAAQAWMRRSRLRVVSAQDGKETRARLEEYHQALLEHVATARARLAGADAFATAAQELVTLARSGTGKRSAAAALAACRRLFAAFNALVLE